MIPFFRTDGWVKSVQGAAVPGAQIFVCTQPANIATVPPTPLANIFSDVNGLVPITQPILTDGFGHYDFYASAAVYTVVVATAGIIQQVYPDQSVGGASGTSGIIGTALVLQTNGILNGNQLLQNLTGAGSVSIADNGSGTITITGAGILLETNGVPNTLQSIYNLKAGANVTLTSDAFGGVTVNSAATTFGGNASFMYGPGIRDIGTVFGSGGWQAPSATGVNGINTANQVVLYLFQLDVAITITKASISCTNNTIGPVAAFGIYSFSGNKLLDTGTFNCLTSPTVQVNTISSVTIPPGTYWHAQTSSTAGGADTFTGMVLQSSAGARAMPPYVKNTIRCGVAANPSVAGVLPATLGVITAFTPSSAQGDGFCTPLYE